MSGTSGTVQTDAQLLTAFADGQPDGSISPQYVRNLIVSETAHFQTFVSSKSTLTYATTVAVDASVARMFSLTLTGNATLGFPTNLTAGMKFEIFIRQDATGSRTLAYGSGWKFPSGIVPVLSTAANSLDILAAVYDGTTLAGNLVKGIA